MGGHVGARDFGSRRAQVAGLAGGVAAATVIWVAGEAFGGIASGQATDPSSGPLLVLLAATVAAACGLLPGTRPTLASARAHTDPWPTSVHDGARLGAPHLQHAVARGGEAYRGSAQRSRAAAP